MGVNFIHLRLLVVKNIWVQLRSPLWLFLELLCPMMLVFIYTFRPVGVIYPLDRNIEAEKFLLLNEEIHNPILLTLVSGCCEKDTNRWLEYIENTTMLHFSNYDDIESMRLELAEKKQTKRTKSGKNRETRIGIEITMLDFKKPKLNYNLWIEQDALLTFTENPRWGPHLKIYGQDNSRHAYVVQYKLETGFVHYLTDEEPLPTLMATLPRPERIEMDEKLGYFYALMPGLLLLSVVTTTKNIVVERQTIKPYLSVMGLTTLTFYLSHCVVTLVKISAFSIAIGTAAFWSFPSFPWVLAVVSLILFSFSATAFSAMMASFFTSSSTAIQMCVSCWLAQSITPKFFAPDPQCSTLMASLMSLWPSYALHYICKYMIIVSNYGDEVNTWSGLIEAKWTGQHTLAPLIVLATETVLMAVIAILLEIGFFGKFFRVCKKKLSRLKKNMPQVEFLSDADEPFEVDQKYTDLYLENVYKEYPTGEKVVNGLNLKAHRGQVTVLLGHNGAGKTTTFSMICGVEDATSGAVMVCGHLAGSNASRKIIGYCAQMNTLIDQMTVKDHLWLAHGLKQAKGYYWDEGEQLMVTLGMIEHATKKVSKLSGGQKRKLCVGMALIGESQVVLLDEPTAGMDPESRKDVQTLLEKVKKERTILLTTHYMDEAETLGDRIFIMAAGQIVCSGSPQFLKKRFGTGYVLTLVASEGGDVQAFAKELILVIKEYVASAHLGEIRGKQVEISIPVAEQKHFPALFECIERQQSELRIGSFGLSLNSLEQVFLRVSSLTDDGQTDSSSSSSREVPLNETLERLYEEKRHTKWNLYSAQLWAAITKKLIYSLRFWSQLVTQIGLPVLSVVVGLTMYTLAPVVQTNFEIWNHNMMLESEVTSSIFMQSQVSNGKTARFDELVEKPYQMDISLPLTKYLRNNYGHSFFFGVMFHKNQTLLLPNPQYHLSFASAINALSNAHFHLSNATHKIITLTLNTFSTFDLEDSALIARQSLLMMLLLTIMMCQFTVTIVEDRVSNFAHQQLLMGMKPLIYWFGDFLYCLGFFSIQNLIYLFSATFTGILTPLTAVRFFFILLLYYWATIPSVFVVSRFINSSSRAALVHWILLFGTFIFIWFYPNMISIITGDDVYMNEEKWNPMEMTGWELSHLILGLFFPTALMYQLIPVFISWSNGKVPIEDQGELEARIIFYCLCMIVTGATGLLFFLLVQLRNINYFFTRIFHFPCVRRYILKESIASDQPLDNNSEGHVILETTDLCKVYGKNCALAHLSMSIKERECFGLLGVSGAGKTTAFNIITGQMFATQGTAVIDGRDCRKDLILGFCPQYDAIHKDFTGYEALVLLARIYGYPQPHRIANEMIEIVKMAKHAHKKMSCCSGGQRRRISVAASLLPRKCRIVILDEATAGIDPKARRDIWEVLSSVRKYSAILMTAHSMDECEALCSKIGILKHGGLAVIGSSQTLKSKYGSFYTLTMALPSSKMKAEVTTAVANWFPGSVLKSDSFSLHLKWQIPKLSTDCWSSVFASCIKLSEQIGVPDFCLTQSTLQDIFLLLAGENSAHMPKIEESGSTVTSAKT